MAKKRVPGHEITKHPKILRNLCFGCGKDNPHGMHLKFFYHEETESFVARMKLPQRYWGPPKHAHGGIIATILDEAMGKVNKLKHVIALTREMTVEYLKPVPLHKPLVVEGWSKYVRGRRHVNVGEIRNEKGEVLARGRAVFIAIDPHKMFAKYLSRAARSR
jgi:uncharacterized protein (TIGR00369 family)